jgi:hypothetical protein
MVLPEICICRAALEPCSPIAQAGGQERPPHTSLTHRTLHQAENEVPQPHDFEA